MSREQEEVAVNLADRFVQTINGGSSSIKLALFEAGEETVGERASEKP